MGMEILREYFCFEWSVLSRAFKDTLQFAKQHLVIKIIFIILGAGAGVIMSPLEYSPWLNALFIGLITVVLMFIVIGIKNLFTTPFLIWREQKNTLETLQKKNLDVGKLKEIYAEGEILKKIKGDTLNEDRRNIRDWFDKSEETVDEITNSGFMYKKYVSKPSPSVGTEKLQQIHNKKLEKLQEIIIELEK